MMTVPRAIRLYAEFEEGPGPGEVTVAILTWTSVPRVLGEVTVPDEGTWIGYSCRPHNRA